MIRINGLLILMSIAVNSLTTVAFAQSRSGIADVDFSNIFNTQYTCIGIPINDTVYIYAPPSSKSPTNWSLIDSLAIPEGTIAVGSNIRKNIFMTKEMIVFEEYGRYDTLRFGAELPPIDPRLWIRTPHSTEAESYFLSGEKNVCYYREYNEGEERFVWQVSDQLNPHMFKENRTQPVLTEKDGFHKLYLFISGGGSEYLAALFKHRISFFRYPTVHDAQLGDKIIAPSELNFSLPQGAITAFIYDFKYVAVVSQDQIDFYGFDTAQKKWRRVEGIQPLRFASLNPDKNLR